MKKRLKRIAVMALALVLVCCGAGTVTVDADGTSVSTSQGVSFNDSQFNQYHNTAAEATLGTAGDFGLIAFDTLTLNSHTNGNFAAKQLITNGSATGTRNYGPEVNYIQQISEDVDYQLVAGSDDQKDDILVVGSQTVQGKTVSKEKDKNNNMTSNLLLSGESKSDSKRQIVKIQPDNVIVSDNFIDLSEVKQEIINKQNQFASNATSSSNLVETHLNGQHGQNTTDQNNQRIIVNGSGETAYLNLKLDSNNLLTKINSDGSDSTDKTLSNSTPIRVYFNSTNGKYNNLVINVDASDVTAIQFPQIIVYYGSGDPLNGGKYTQETNGEQTDKEGSKFNSHVVLNFKNVTNKNITFDKTENAAILATDANVTFASNINGKVVANKIDAHGEFHRNDFIMEAIHDSFNVTKTFAQNVTTKPVSVKVGLYKADAKNGEATGEPIQTQIIKISGDGPYTTTFTGLDPNTRYVAKEISYKMSGDSDYTGIDAADSKYKPQYGTAKEAEPKNAASATDNTVTAKTSSGSGTQYSDTIGNSSKGTHGANRTRKQWTVNKTFKDSSKASNVKSITVQLFKYDSQGKTAVKDSSGKDITKTIDITENNNVYSGSLNYNNPSLRDLNNGEYYRFDEISYTLKGNPEKTVEMGSDDSEFTADVNDPNPTSTDTTKNTETITNKTKPDKTIIKTGIRTTTDAVGLAVILGSAGLVIALAIRKKMLERA
jgi:hypothetical protein